MALTCRTCKAPVFFAKNEKTGRNMILDEQPTREGNVIVVQGSHSEGDTARVYGNAAAAAIAYPDAPRFIDHHATCPDAEEWRARTAQEQLFDVPPPAPESAIGA